MLCSYICTTGTIPKELSQLKKMEILLLNDNLLTGILPYELGVLSALEWLFVSRNLLYGPIPTSIGDMQKLVWVFDVSYGLKSMYNLCLSDKRSCRRY